MAILNRVWDFIVAYGPTKAIRILFSYPFAFELLFVSGLLLIIFSHTHWSKQLEKNTAAEYEKRSMTITMCIMWIFLCFSLDNTPGSNNVEQIVKKQRELFSIQMRELNDDLIHKLGTVMHSFWTNAVHHRHKTIGQDTGSKILSA